MGATHARRPSLNDGCWVTCRARSHPTCTRNPKGGTSARCGSRSSLVPARCHLCAWSAGPLRAPALWSSWRAVRDGSSCLPCSNVKRLLRTSGVLELIETTLNYTKLTELLRTRGSATVGLCSRRGMGARRCLPQELKLNFSLRVLTRVTSRHASSSARTSPCDSRTRP